MPIQTMNHNAAITGYIPGRNSPCPCGSRVKAKHCCLISKNIFVKKPIEIKVDESSKTNFSNSSCLASFTNDCVKTITGEHYFSKSILKLIDDEKVEIKGWPHNQAGLQTIPIKNLVVNCLCERHNNMLSPFDETAHSIFKTLIDFDSVIAKGKSIKDTYRLFHHWDFERWLIKTLVMTSEAKFSRSNGVTQLLPLDLKRQYLQILFENRSLANKGAGFYYLNEHNEKISFFPNFDFSPVTSTATGELDGCIIAFGGIKFVFSSRELLHIEGIPITEKQHRPWRFVYGEGTSQMILDFSVKNGGNETIQFSASPTSTRPIG